MTTAPPQPAGTAWADGTRRLRARRLTPARGWTLRLTSVVVILVAWQMYGGRINPVLLSDPTAVAAAFVAMIKDGTLPHALASSLIVLGLGLVSGAVAGVILGLVCGRSAAFDALIELPVNALYAVPAVALIPVIVLWFGFGITSKTIVVFLFVVFRS